MILGPPGTGKSKTLVALISLLARSGKRVLISSHSHMAVDKLFNDSEKIGVFENLQVLRYGDPSRIDQKAIKYNLKKKVYDLKKRGNLDPGLDEKAIKKAVIKSCQIVFSTQISLMNDDLYEIFSQEKFDYAIIDESSQSPYMWTLMPVSVAKKIIIAGDHH